MKDLELEYLKIGLCFGEFKELGFYLFNFLFEFKIIIF